MAKEHITTVMENLRKALQSNRGLSRKIKRTYPCVEEKKNVKGRVVESGKIYELIFTSCDCPIHTEAEIESNRLCECSRQSMICVFKELVPERRFHIECIKSILSGDEVCCHRIIFDD